MRLVHTFSIVAYDPTEQAWGVAVASKFLAVGAVVPYARADIGAVATQSYAKMSFGPDGLILMASGCDAQETLNRLLARDEQRDMRQVGIVDAHGGSATFTGAKCHDWAGGMNGEGYAAQGNLLTGQEVVAAMVDAYLATSGELADRLMTALTAGDVAGGDKRGRQSAALLVARPNGGYGGDNDRYLDLRVDDDPYPVGKLSTLLDIHHLYFGATRPEDRLPITPDLARELQAILIRTGDRAAEPDGEWDDATKAQFDALVGRENLEERWRNDDPNVIDRVALNYLRSRFAS